MAIPDLPRLSSLPRLPALPLLSSLPQVPHLPQPPILSQLPSLSQLSGLPQIPFSASRQLPGLLSGLLPSQWQVPPYEAVMTPAAVPACPFPQTMAPDPALSGVIKPMADPARPAPARQPADRSTSTGQARDSGGGNAPSMGVVSSSWRPETAVTGRHLATDLITRGRTVRYAGPPS
ncbi:hypothetical protein AB0M20_38855 [Actinoplanes sp. NPDC051633]|uniref:hypothetical protein n=1 Tax=Actinoplanes sp. NPDC051633 TaxID=3155670 RepID=UPI00341C53AB